MKWMGHIKNPPVDEGERRFERDESREMDEHSLVETYVLTGSKINEMEEICSD